MAAKLDLTHVTDGVKATWSSALAEATGGYPLWPTLSGMTPVMQLKQRLNPMFKDVDDTFTFTTKWWKDYAKEGVADPVWVKANAYRHRDEALRRKAVCRLSDLAAEAAHWHACAAFLTNLCKLDPLGEEDGGPSA